ncbi:MAG: hypothetical protein L6R19_13290 [Alphaproteobacteria bacterium]|nr:hypothetical protein [Alphaproteobacteria bacterium]
MKLRVAFALALAVVLVAPAEAGFNERTREICYGSKVNYNQMLEMVARGDPDAIFCRALWDALAYADETFDLPERNLRRARAAELRGRAEKLGYDFSQVKLLGMTFDEAIADGDALSANGGVRQQTGTPLGDYMGCMAQVGVQCTVQCGGYDAAGCISMCQGGNAWRCNQ